MRVDTRSGFNILTAAVVEGNWDVLVKAYALPSHFEPPMGVSAVADTLANLKTKRQDHHKIEEFFREMVDKVNIMAELHQCKRGNDAEKAVKLVLNDGLDINIPALRNRTPLLWASLSSSGELIQTLIDLGSNVNAQRTDDKVTPLTLSTCWNDFMTVNLLLDHGADANIAAGHGYTPLHLAVMKGNQNLVKLFLEKNALVNTQNANDNSPLHHCTQLSAKDFLILPSFWFKREATSTFKTKKEEPLYFLV